ncbi:hypothetical protein MNBD_GAMMA09-3031 [hydrothermal vent metagenome]|uniref:Competence protein ComFB n=1 Tax=hydrothermal vent metagenome TaxID=652676 RepID=A0A3B0XFS2_9ZZZZ
MDFTSIHNYYEHLVIDYLKTDVMPELNDKPSDFFLDVACYALSKLPSRYMRHEIDMAFYMHQGERRQMIVEVKNAVDNAVEYITANFNKDERYE